MGRWNLVCWIVSVIGIEIRIHNNFLLNYTRRSRGMSRDPQAVYQFHEHVGAGGHRLNSQGAFPIRDWNYLLVLFSIAKQRLYN